MSRSSHHRPVADEEISELPIQYLQSGTTRDDAAGVCATGFLMMMGSLLVMAVTRLTYQVFFLNISLEMDIFWRGAFVVAGVFGLVGIGLLFVGLSRLTDPEPSNTARRIQKP